MLHLMGGRLMRLYGLSFELQILNHQLERYGQEIASQSEYDKIQKSGLECLYDFCVLGCGIDIIRTVNPSIHAIRFNT